MIILGVDPGYGRCGYGVIEIVKRKVSVLDFGCIEPETKIETQFKLEKVYDGLTKIAEQFKPDILAVEKIFFFKNAKTVVSVGAAIGVVKLMGVKNNLVIEEYTPLQIKVALTGYGKADKKQVQQMVKLVCKLDQIPQPDDAADGLAVAYTAGVHNKFI